MADNPITSAIAIIGEAREDDSKLAAKDHPKILKSSAPALAEILEREEVVSVIKQYEKSDADAGAAQTRFKSVAMQANFAVFFTVLLGAAILAGAQLPKEITRPVLITLTIAAAVSGALATMWLFQIRTGNLLERWMTARANAEMMRLSYFLLVTNPQPPSGIVSSLPLPLLQLEYFRRYQLELQITYYRTRGDRHQTDADRTLGIGMFAVLIASLASALGGALAVVNPKLAAIAALGPVAAGLSALASAKEALAQDRRNAERYGRTLTALQMLEGKIGEVRKVAAAGELPPVQAYVQTVQEQLSLEHRQWLDTAENTRAALQTLEQSLKDAKDRIEKRGNSPQPSSPAPNR